MGDDLADLPILRRVGLPIAVANAVAEVKEISDLYHQRAGRPWCRPRGDRGIASARGEWPAILERYFREQAAGAA